MRCVGMQETDSRTREEKLRDQVLFLLESAYPNILEIDDLARYVNLRAFSVSTLMGVVLWSELVV